MLFVSGQALRISMISLWQINMIKIQIGRFALRMTPCLTFIIDFFSVVYQPQDARDDFFISDFRGVIDYRKRSAMKIG